jgi:hypothetical protein
MFKRKFNLIESDEGFSVKFVSRTELQYSVGKKKLRIDAEMLASKSGFLIYRSSIVSWLPPFENELFEEKEKDKIIDNVRQALNYCKQSIEVI